MKLNCKKIIVAAFKLEENLFAPYYDQLISTLNSFMPGQSLENWLRLVPEEQFATQVLSDPRNVGICFAPIGMVESSSLNHLKGIRAAIVHNQYIAEMCRKHNSCNVCVLGVDCIGIKLSGSLALSYLLSEFDNQERNMLRLGKIADFETWNEQKLHNNNTGI